MKAVLVFVALIIISTIFCSEQTTDFSEIDPQAREDMLVTMQYSAQYRFSADLQIGDRVAYKRINAPDDLEYDTVSLEVIDRNDDGILIREEFDGNVVNVLWDPSTKKIIDLYGTNAAGEAQHPELLPENVVEQKIVSFKKSIKEFDATDAYEDKGQQRITCSGTKEIQCKRYEPLFSDEIMGELSTEEKAKVKEEMSLYFSTDVPKLIPFVDVALGMLNSKEVLDGNTGFVKNQNLEMQDYVKAASE